MKKGHLGFSLLEMVVSIAIIALLSLVLSQVFLTILRTNTKTEGLKEVKQNGEMALETMVRMVQNATSVSCVSAQSISLVNADGGITTFGCAFMSGSSRVASTSAEGTQYLTSENVSMGGTTCAESSLAFICSSVAGVPSSVTIGFDLAVASVPDESFAAQAESFQTSVIMRNIQE